MKHSPNLRTAGRAGLAVSAAALLTFGLAAPAAADPAGTYEGSVRAQYVDNHQSGDTVWMSSSEDGVGTNLFKLRLEDGSELVTYCIDLETGIRSSAWYEEDDWANYPGKGDFAEPGRVHWILQNGYPSVSAEEFNSLRGANRVEPEQALAATQAAIWHYSNGATLTRGHANVKAIYNHLVENAEVLASEPAPTLSITPNSATGQAGDTVGEFQISTNAADVPVTLDVPEGVELVDISTGEPVGESLSDGDKVGFSVPADADAGEASFSLETTATVQQGRLFKGEDAHKATQTLITAEDSDVSVDASASAEWSEADQPAPSPEPEPTPDPEPTPTDEPDPKPTPTGEPSKPAEDDKPAPGKDDEPTLPVTGGALAGLVAAGLAALGAGGGALYLSRKRKAATGEDTDV